jgi:hypothetical protein
MAFELVQEFKFENVNYSYDRGGDVLDISFGPPAPAIALQVEDWLAIQVRISPPALQGMTIVGFRRLFAKINQYIERELPQRIKRLTTARLALAYDNETDTFVMRWEKESGPLRKRIQKLFLNREGYPTIFEPLHKADEGVQDHAGPSEALKNVYVEKMLPSKDIVGIKLLEFTKCGPVAFEAFLGAIVDMLFEPTGKHDENIHLITNALMERLDWSKLADVAV